MTTTTSSRMSHRDRRPGEDVDGDSLQAAIAARQRELDEAIAARSAAQQLADDLTWEAANDHVAYTAARDELAAAEAALEAAESDGRALHDAQAKRDAARASFDVAWTTWAYATDQKARRAQAALDRIDHIIDTYPPALERARRALHEQHVSRPSPARRR